MDNFKYWGDPRAFTIDQLNDANQAEVQGDQVTFAYDSTEQKTVATGHNGLSGKVLLDGERWDLAELFPMGVLIDLDAYKLSGVDLSSGITGRMTMDDVFPNKKDGLFGGQSKSSINDYVYYCVMMAALHNGYEMSPVDLSMAFGTTPLTFSTDNAGDRLAAPKVSELTNVVILPYNVTLSDTPGSYELGAGEYERDGNSYYCFYLKGDNDLVTGEFVVGLELPTGTETVVDMGSVLVNGKLPNQTDVPRVNVPVRQWMVILDVLRADYYNTSTSERLLYTPDGEGQFITRSDQVFPTLKLRATPKP